MEYTSIQDRFIGEEGMNSPLQVPRSQPSNLVGRTYGRWSLVLLRLAALTSTDAGLGSTRYLMPEFQRVRLDSELMGDVAGQRKSCAAACSARFREPGIFFLIVTVNCWG